MTTQEQLYTILKQLGLADEDMPTYDEHQSKFLYDKNKLTIAMQDKVDSTNVKIAEAQDKCLHENFQAVTRVGRLSETEGGPIYRYMLEVQVRCAHCFKYFEFIGVPAGHSPMHPMASSSFIELRAPIRPSTGAMATNLHYQVKPDEKKIKIYH